MIEPNTQATAAPAVGSGGGLANLPDDVVMQMIKACRKAAGEIERKLHVPTPEWPDGFYGKEDADIIACAGMRAAVDVLAAYLANND